ncbi:MAG: hypothetical protein AB8G96_11135 [Phycisphaerales bacterium]
MPTASTLAWVMLIGSLVGVVAFVWMARRALFADRAAGRRRCPECWFDMTYSPGLVCGECGREAGSESELTRTRRKPVMAVLCMIGATLAGMRLIEVGMTGTWAGHLPDRVLFTFFEFGGPDLRAVSTEMRRRTARFDRDDWRRIAFGAVDGAPGRRPEDESWGNTYGNWFSTAVESLTAADGVNTFDAQQLESDRREIQDLIFALCMRSPPRVALDPPPNWPVGRPIPIGVRIQDPWIRTIPTRATINDTDAGRAAWSHAGRPWQRPSFVVHLPPATEAGEHPISVELEIDRARPDTEAWESSAVVQQDAIVDIVGPDETDDAWTGVDEPGAAAAVAGIFSDGIIHYASGQLPVRVFVDRQSAALRGHPGLAIGLEVEVRRNGALGRTLRIWFHAAARAPEHVFEVPFSDDAVLGPPPTADDVWELRIRGDEELARRVENVDRWWSGQLILRPNVRPRNQPAPGRGWRPVAPAPEDARTRQSAANPAASSTAN